MAYGVLELAFWLGSFPPFSGAGRCSLILLVAFPKFPCRAQLAGQGGHDIRETPRCPVLGQCSPSRWSEGLLGVAVVAGQRVGPCPEIYAM